MRAFAIAVLLVSCAFTSAVSAQQMPPPEQVRRQIEERARGTLVTPGQPVQVTPPVDCGPNAQLVPEGNRWRCTPTRPPPQGHRIWIALAPEEGSLSEIRFINPGDRANRVVCRGFDDGGSIHVDRGIVRNVAPGAMGLCRTTLGGERNERLFYTIIIAERPIVPMGFGTDPFARGEGWAVYHQALHPVDCDNPAGFEFVCRMAAVAP